jgi:hypothetical protein
MTLRDIFGKKDAILSIIRPDMKGSELDDFVRNLPAKLISFIQDHSISFYRDIGSHDFSGYPGVRDEFFYLALFATEYRLRLSLDDCRCANAVLSLRDYLSSFLRKHDRKLEQQAFWDRYEQRATLYNSLLSSGSRLADDENIISAFGANVMSRLHDWPSLVSHHSANAANSVLAGICPNNI